MNAPSYLQLSPIAPRSIFLLIKEKVPLNYLFIAAYFPLAWRNLMKKLKSLIILVLIWSILLITSSCSSEDQVINNLRGRWDIDWNFNGAEDGNLPPMILFINDIRPSTDLQDTYYAVGCMRSTDTDAFMPLSMRADFSIDDNTYNVVILGTIVPITEIEPFVIRLEGKIEIGGKAVTDDTAAGDLTTEVDIGTWTGSHHDRRSTKCPSLSDFGQGAQGDVYGTQDLAFQPPKYWSTYEIHTTIVSSGLLVERPDGSTFIVQEFTDVFSPGVDFTGHFRFLENFEGSLISAEAYKFVLLDVFGDPIPGTESSDIWLGCDTGAPTNLITSAGSANTFFLSWDSVNVVPGKFEPASDPQIGFYQISISPFEWDGGQNYGANGIQSPSHQIPWDILVPGQPGIPDGWDYGQALSEFDDGLYQVSSEVISFPSAGSGGFGHECSVNDSSEFLMMEKQAGVVSFEK
jgi:hypothetical protein